MGGGNKQSTNAISRLLEDANSRGWSDFIEVRRGRQGQSASSSSSAGPSPGAVAHPAQPALGSSPFVAPPLANNPYALLIEKAAEEAEPAEPVPVTASMPASAPVSVPGNELTGPDTPREFAPDEQERMLSTIGGDEFWEVVSQPSPEPPPEPFVACPEHVCPQRGGCVVSAEIRIGEPRPCRDCLH